jgi:hypothetical protein
MGVEPYAVLAKEFGELVKKLDRAIGKLNEQSSGSKAQIKYSKEVEDLRKLIQLFATVNRQNLLAALYSAAGCKPSPSRARLHE